MISSQGWTDSVVSKGSASGSHRHLNFSIGTSSKTLFAINSPFSCIDLSYFFIFHQTGIKVNEVLRKVSISFPVINTVNRSGYSKKTGPLRKFKSGTSDKSDSDVQKSIKNLYFQ
jgi:hypothetical protein